MYTLSLSPRLADAIELTGNEMQVLQSVKQRADAYLQQNPTANVNPEVLGAIKHYQDNVRAAQIAHDELVARFR